MIVSKNIASSAYQGVLFKSETPKYPSPKEIRSAKPEGCRHGKAPRKSYAGLEKPYDLDEWTAVFGENIAAKIYRGQAMRKERLVWKSKR